MWAEDAVHRAPSAARGLVVVGGSSCIGGDSKVRLGALWASLKAAVTSRG